jgi:hypothetical protein
LVGIIRTSPVLELIDLAHGAGSSFQFLGPMELRRPDNLPQAYYEL